MTKLMYGEITHINTDIVSDIEVLIEVGEAIAASPLFEHKKNIADAVIRVKDYLATYKLDEES